ncbi:MAG: 50S ribosomal protein L11 methyltransferase [Clostridia bacterium]|nr:50S ribosomal protein L11 methyltransferase [Clostridia bacterium]
MDWLEIKVTVPVEQIDTAGAICSMTVPYGIYIEDYSDLEQAALEIAHIDLIDEDLLRKDRSHAWVHIYIPPEGNPAEAVSFIKERLDAEGIEYSVDTENCKNEDWENNWKKYFHPIKVGERLLIRPVWEEPVDAGDRVVLDLEPGLAFGSGTHETTRLCLTAMEPYITPEAEVLDIGCGSGILSVSALLLGAKRAVGVDIDPHAVKTARDNAERNGIGEDRYTLITGNLADAVTGRYDIIVANIVADAIIALAGDAKKFMKPGGVFIVSGIVDPREADVVTALTGMGYDLFARHYDNGWLCFEAKNQPE